MIIQKDGYVLDVDIEATRQYSENHSLCDCNEDRNLYAQIQEKFPKLTTFLAELGLLIDRPDETGSCASKSVALSLTNHCPEIDY